MENENINLKENEKEKEKEKIIDDEIIKVYIDEQKNKGKCIIKEINLLKLNEKEKNMILNEEFIISQFKHSNIIKCNEFHLNNNKINIIMEYPEGGNLLNKINENNNKGFEEEQIIKWLIEICEGIKYIHRNSIFDLNLKSSNIFLTKDNHIKIGNFKIIKKLNNEYEKISTQIIKNETYDFENDIWNLGIILYELTQLKHPFHNNGNNNEEIKNNIKKGKYDNFSDQSYSKGVLNLIKNMLKVESNKRLDINEILLQCYLILFNSSSTIK